MLKNSLVPLAVTCATLLAATGRAQANNPSTDNNGRLQNAISLDRATYFPGEDAVLTLTARNSQRTRLEVPEPFGSTTGCFDLSKLAPAGSFVPLSARPVCPFRAIESSTAKAVFEPGEERRATVAGDALWHGAESAPSSAASGYYQVAYHNSNASAVFRVVAPHLEAATAVRLRDIEYTDQATGHVRRLTAYMHVFSVRWNNQSYLCVAQSPSLQDKAIVTDGSGNVVSVNVPYRRLATVPDPVTSIKATANVDNNLAITWVDSTGAARTTLSAGTPHPSTSGDVEIGLDSTFEKVASGASLQFHARVAGSGNNGVRWSLAPGPGAPAGASTGSMTATGRYSAPSDVSVPYVVIVVAQSVVDATKSAFGVVNLQPRTEVTGLTRSDLPRTSSPVAAFTVSAAAPLTGPIQ
jgi:hypothetical protein